MRHKSDEIEIKGPPLGEFKKKPSCIRRSCTLGCGSILLFLVGALVLLKFTTSEKPKELKSLPDFFPSGIPVYDEDNIETIVLTNEHKKNQELEILVMLPKIIIAPFVAAKDENKGNYWGNLKDFIKTPIVPTKESVTVEWHNLSTEPDFLQEFYIKELKKNNYEVIVSKDQGTRRQFSFKDDNTSGLFFINDSPQTEGTDFFSLSVTITKKPK